MIMGAMIMYCLVIAIAIGGYFYFRHQDKLEEKRHREE